MKRRILFGLLIAGMISSLLLSCNLLGGSVSASDRIDLFIEDANAGNYSILYTHFMEGYTTQYDQIKSPSYWDTTRLASAYGPFSVTKGTATDQGTYISIPVQLTNSNSTYSYTFNMMEAADGSYYIYQLIDEGDDTFSIRLLFIE